MLLKEKETCIYLLRTEFIQIQRLRFKKKKKIRKNLAREKLCKKDMKNNLGDTCRFLVAKIFNMVYKNRYT